MNILKQLFNEGFKPGTCSDLVEWIQTDDASCFLSNHAPLIGSFPGWSYLSAVCEVNTELRKPLSITDFTGEDALFEGFDVFSKNGCHEIVKDNYVIDFFERTKRLAVTGLSIQSPTREDFIRSCNKHGIDLTTSNNPTNIGNSEDKEKEKLS